ncbi:MAG: glycosyltransferase, partial [Pedobacter sp.]
SHREGFPNVLLQAGAMNCPIICSRIEGNIDIVEDGVTGLIFPVRDSAALRDTMQKALEDPARLSTYATALRQKIEKHFDQPVVHHQLEEKYIHLLSNMKE